MSKTENVELTVLCLIEDGDKILLQNRVKKDWRGYALPGGHVEPGESFVDAVIREMKEETGLTVLNPRLVGVKQFPLENGRYVVLLFKATQWSGDLMFETIFRDYRQEKDDYFSKKMQRDLIRLMHEPRIAYVSGGHLTTVLQAEKFIETIRAFLPSLGSNADRREWQ